MTSPDAPPGIEQLTACPLCTGGAWTPRPVPQTWIGPDVFGDLRDRLRVVCCEGCGLLFTNPRPSNERLDAFYSGDTYSCHSVAGSASAGAKADFLLQRIARFLPRSEPGTLLDFGAGGGAFLAHAHSRGWTVRGFEPGQRGVESCRDAGLDVTDKVSDLPQNSFDVVTLFHVFEHIGDPAGVLELLRGLLRQDGRLVIEVPNATSLRSRLSLPLLTRHAGFDERFRAFPIHLMYYTGQTLRRMLEKSGWVVEGSFTLGMGLDELRMKSDMSDDEAATTRAHHSARTSVARSVKPSLKHRVRDAFLAAGLGENLAVVARRG
ncbi:MAG: class I SAM-dependent methyltransferase [Gemmatimonadales bacterium]